MTKPLVKFENVSIVFGARPERALPLMDEGLDRDEIQQKTGQILGVHDCSLEVCEGEISVFMGLSGSGKSTLLRAVNGLNPVTRGKMLVHDGTDLLDITKADSKTMQRLRIQRVSMVFQQFALLPWRSVIENVTFGLEIAGVPKDERYKRAMVQLELVNLADWAHNKVGELSGGMQQRVGLARAYATEAPVLLMDEPFSALDPLIRSKLQDELLELQQEFHRTILFVSHDLDEAVKIGTKVAIMQGGRIVQADTPQTIILNPATDYVCEFVSNLNFLRALSARDVMNEIDGKEALSSLRTVSSDMPLEQVMVLLAKDPTIITVQQDGKIKGTITSDDIVRRIASC